MKDKQERPKHYQPDSYPNPCGQVDWSKYKKIKDKNDTNKN